MSVFNDFSEEQLIELLNRYCPEQFDDWSKIYISLDAVEFGFPVSDDQDQLANFIYQVYDMDADVEKELERYDGDIRIVQFSGEGIFEMGGIQLITNKNLLEEYKNRFDDGSKQKLENELKHSRKELKDKCAGYVSYCKEYFFKRLNNSFKLSEIEKIIELYEEDFKQLKDYLKNYIDCVVNLRILNSTITFDVEDKCGDMYYSNLHDLGRDISDYFIVKAETSYQYVSSEGELDQFVFSFEGEELGEQDKEEFVKLLSKYIFCTPDLDHLFVDLENKKFLRVDDFENFIEELFKEVGKPMFIPYYD